MLLKLYPSITKYILCDIPPQLYIQERYLEAVFPGEVTDFMETRSLKTIDMAATKRILIIAPGSSPAFVARLTCSGTRHRSRRWSRQLSRTTPGS